MGTWKEICICIRGAFINFDVVQATGQVFDLYCDIHTHVDAYSEKIEGEKELNWKVGKNSLFKHCPKKKIAKHIKRLFESDDIMLFPYLDTDDKEAVKDAAEDRQFLEKMAQFYGITLPED